MQGICRTARSCQKTGWWRRRELNPWPPQCHCGALPTELRPQPFLRNYAPRCYRPPPRLSIGACSCGAPLHQHLQLAHVAHGSTTTPKMPSALQTNRIEISAPIYATIYRQTCCNPICRFLNPVRFAETHVFESLRAFVTSPRSVCLDPI